MSKIVPLILGCALNNKKQLTDKAITYFHSFTQKNPDKTPHFLWNAKMHFGKTFTTYQQRGRLLGDRVW